MENCASNHVTDTVKSLCRSLFIYFFVIMVSSTTNFVLHKNVCIGCQL